MSADQTVILRDEILRGPDDSISVAGQHLVPSNGITVSPEAIRAAQFPVLYIAARDALRACDAMDEVKSIDDKWVAAAVYAKQAEDKELELLARRISLRAERRMGELLNELRDNHKAGTGPFSASAKHGISKERMVRAVKIASAPEAVFEELLNDDEAVSSKAKFTSKLAPHLTGYNGASASKANSQSSKTSQPQEKTKETKRGGSEKTNSSQQEVKVETKTPPKVTRAVLEQRKVVLSTLCDFYQFWQSHADIDIDAVFQHPDARSAAMSMVNRIAMALTNFRENPEGHDAALNCIQQIQKELFNYENRPVDKKSMISLLDAVESKIRTFKRIMASTK